MDKILLCRKAYLECFCEVTEENGILTYTDEFIKDMYSHNFFEVKTGVDKEDVINKLNQRIAGIQETGHCVVVFSPDYSVEKIDEIAKATLKRMELTTTGCYVLGTSKITAWKERNDCEIYAFTADRINDVIQKDIKMDGEMANEDFGKRRTLRKGDVYEKNRNMDNYLLYYHNELIGTCELFINDETAKIEDFDVLDQYQRMGYGTTLLKHVVCKAIEKGAKTIFLNADEEGTAKDMYIKLGFSKIFEYCELMWADWME